MNWFDKPWNSKYNPFGNADGPVPITSQLWLYWYFVRNPIHNLWHTGLVSKIETLITYKSGIQSRKWNLVLPFFSYKGKRWEGYIDWRPDSKMFDIALRRVKNASYFGKMRKKITKERIF